MPTRPSSEATSKWLAAKRSFDALVTPYLEQHSHQGGAYPLSDDHQAGGPLSRRIFERFYPFTFDYLEIVKGRTSSANLSINTEMLNLPKRVFSRSRIDDLRPEMREPLSDLIDSTMHLGILANYAVTNCPSRNEYKTAEFDGLFPHFVLESLQSAVRIQDYLRDVSPLPAAFWNLYWQNEVEGIVSAQLGLKRVNFIKQGRLSSHLRSLFYSGVLFGFWIDVEPQVREDRRLRLFYGMDHLA